MSVLARLDRRRFLGGLAATTLLPVGGALGCGSASGGEGAPREYWLSAQGDDEATFGLVASPDPHERASRIETGFRGHDVAQHPTRPWEVVLPAIGNEASPVNFCEKGGWPAIGVTASVSSLYENPSYSMSVFSTRTPATMVVASPSWWVSMA